MATVISMVAATIPVILVMGVVMTVISALKWFLDRETVTAAAQVMQGEVESVNISDYITIENKNIVFKKDANGQDIYDIVTKTIDDKGLDAKELRLDKRGVIEDIINAEIVTEYPYLGGDGLQGIVNFYRRRI